MAETYDRWGNRTTQTVTAGYGPGVSLTFNLRNQPNGYTYDASGNLTYEPGLGNNYSYDAENDLTGVSGGASAAYTYDGEGTRVQKTANGTTTVYIFSGSKVVAEYDNGAAVGSPSREYVYGAGQMLAMVSGSTGGYDAASFACTGRSIRIAAHSLVLRLRSIRRVWRVKAAIPRIRHFLLDLSIAVGFIVGIERCSPFPNSRDVAASVEARFCTTNPSDC